MSKLLINFLVIPRSDYLKEMRKLLIVMQKKWSHLYSLKSVKFDEKISLGHDNKMGTKDDGDVKTYKILIQMFVNLKKVRNLWVNM